MDIEQFRGIHQKFVEASQAYSNYIEQFFTRTWDGEVVKEATKALDKEGLAVIKELGEKMKSAKRELEDFLGVYRPTKN